MERYRLIGRERERERDIARDRDERDGEINREREKRIFVYGICIEGSVLDV